MSAAFLVVDKPEGITSHDVVAAVRAVTGAKKVGHTGTLDPFATGVLALALGGATRLVQYLDESIKVYELTIALGSATDTGDPTGQVIREAPVPSLDAAHVAAVLDTFVGPRMQRPPAYSAVKHKGRPLYEYARKGEVIEVAERPITVHSVTLTGLEADVVRLTLSCSRGTYARVLAEEIGVALGTEGHLRALCRSRSGPFHLADALTMQQLADLVAVEPGAPWADVLLSQGRPRAQRPAWRPRGEVIAGLKPWIRRPLGCLDHLPIVDVAAADVQRVRSGALPSRVPPGVVVGGRYLVAHGDELLAIAEAAPRGPAVVCVVT